MSRLLLDTHVLLWSIYRPERLPEDVAGLIRDRSNDVLFSAISILEVAIKTALGRPDFNVKPTDAISDAAAVGLVELPVRAAAAALVSTLPPIHKDPFDRLLVAQALHEPAILLTADHALEGYTPLVRRFVANR